MRNRKRQPRAAGQLEQTFYGFFLRLDDQDRRRVVAELSQPFQRLWLIVDERGARRMEE